MKVNHHQFKNAVAYLSEKLKKQFPSHHYVLEGAVFRLKQQAWELRAYPPIPEGVIMDITRLPPPLVPISEIGTDDSISLDNIFIETLGVSKAIDTAARFINHADKISSASLRQLLNESTKSERKWKLYYEGADNKHDDIFLDILVNPQTETPLSIELDYPRHEIAIEIAEDFIRHSTSFVSHTKEGLSGYYGKGIHHLSFKGIDIEGETIELDLVVNSQSESIISSEIRRSKPE